MTIADFPLTGVAYIAQIENEHLGAEEKAICNNCFAPGQENHLKRCTGCKLANYCSRKCQKQSWSNHKAFCALVQGRGNKDDYMSSLERNIAYEMLIDSYRLRVDTDHSYRGEDHGMYYDADAAAAAAAATSTTSGKSLSEKVVWAHGDAIEDFQNYLDSAESSGLLPKWWSWDERMECLSRAVDKTNEDSIFGKVDQQRLLAKYGGDISVQFALRIMAELIVGYEGYGPPADDSSFHILQGEEESGLEGNPTGGETSTDLMQGTPLDRNSQGPNDAEEEDETDIPLDRP